MIDLSSILEKAKEQANIKGKGILFHIYLYLYTGENNYRTSYYRTLGYTTTEFYLDQEFSNAPSNTASTR